jgi:restriction system protein
MPTFDYTFDQLINPCLEALHKLGGSGTNSEIETEVSKLLKLKEKQVNEIHRGNVTKLDYRLRWARNYLKRAGILENSARGVWSLTKKGKSVKKVDAVQTVRKIAALSNKGRKHSKPKGLQAEAEEEVEELNWQEELLHVVKKMHPSAFERLSQLVLRELGFKNVEVTGKSGDGGIDGKGILNIGSVISFHVVFQCKRYRKTVTPTVVRDFRGALQGRADKGLIITTGAFTREARSEAQRDGALAIDLMDGNELAQKLKDLGLGVRIETVEKVEVNKDWFNSI